MTMFGFAFFRRYLLPGLIFQSVVIGGGYATGRELVQFFLKAGPLSGLLGIIVATGVWCITMAVSFELARLAKAFDYRRFFEQLLGRAWFLYEIAFLLLVILILSVLGAASGEIIAELAGLPNLVGILTMMILVGIFVFFGTSLIEKVLASWSLVLYGTYAAFFILSITTFGDRISANFSSRAIESGWFLSGMRYAGYNVAAVPVILFTVRHLTKRRHAVVAGLLGGPIAMVPALLFFIIMVGYYPKIIQEPIPANFLMGQIGAPALILVFQLVIFGTFVETGTGIIHSVNERVAGLLQERGKSMPNWLRPLIAVTMLVVAIFVASRVGLINLVAGGYSSVSYIIILLFLVPLFTIGLWRIRRLSRAMPIPA